MLGGRLESRLAELEVEMLGGRLESRLAELEVEIGRLRGENAGLKELLAAREREIARRTDEQGRVEARLAQLLDRFVDLAERMQLPSSQIPVAPSALLRPGHENKSGNGDSPDEEQLPLRLNRKARQQRQLDQEMVEQGFMTSAHFTEKWGRFEEADE